MRTTTLGRCASTCLFVLGVSAQARAGDWYVNPATGNDANDGTSPATAWRTLVYAGDAAPPGAFETIHLAPGTYFESAVRFRGQHLVGDAGPSTTIVDGGGASNSILQSFRNTVGTTPSTFASIRAVSLRNAANGISISTEEGNITTSIEDVVVSDVTYGIWGAAIAHVGESQPTNLYLTVRNARISQCNSALSLWDRNVSQIHAEISDSILEGGTTSGLKLESWPGGELNADVLRCRIRNNAQQGVYVNATDGGRVLANFQSGVISGNPNGLSAFGSESAGTLRDLRFQDCTITGNSVRSLSALAATNLRLRGTLIHGNGIDAVQGNVVESVANWIGGPDPHFVDAAGGDWRLRITSPCIDVGDAASPPGQRDLLGRPRPIDGNLDLVEHADIGAFEFAPLDVQTTGATGSIARIELTARASGTAFVYFARSGTVAPRTTAYGEWDLGPRAPLQFTRMLVADVPSVLMRTIPPGAGMPGETISLQALLPSGAAPLGQAWSNPIEITIQP